MWAIVSTLLLLAASGFVSLLVLILFEDQVSKLLAGKMKLNFLARRRKVDGLWLSVYWRNGRSEGTKPHVHLVKIVSIGKRVFCEAIAGQGHKYSISARFSNDQYLTGDWENLDPNVVYRGAVQLRLREDGVCMSGKWIGWNSRGGINSGPWFVVKIPNSEDLKLRSGDIENLKRRIISEIAALDIIAVIDQLEAEKGKDEQTSWSDVDLSVDYIETIKKALSENKID